MSIKLTNAPDALNRVLLGEDILIPTTEDHPLDRFEKRVVKLKLPPTYKYTVHKDHQCMDDPDYVDDFQSVFVEFTSNLYLTHEEAYEIAEEIDEWEEEEDYISSAEEEYMVELEFKGKYFELTSHLTMCNGVILPERYSLEALELIQDIIESDSEGNNMSILANGEDDSGVYLDGEMIISHRAVIKHNDSTKLVRFSKRDA